MMKAFGSGARYHRIGAALLFVAMLLTGTGAVAAEAAGEQELYLVVLQPRRAGEPPFDAAKHGGTIQFRQGSHMALLLPEGAVEDVRRDPRIRVIQRAATENGAAAKSAVLPAARVSAMSTPGTSNWTTGTYTYDPSGNITGVGPIVGTNTVIGSDVYRYDRIGRLTSASVADGSRQRNVSYQYDAAGNQISVTTDGVQVGLPVDETTNRLHSTLGVTYDAAGNLTGPPAKQSDFYRYDPAGMLSEAGGDLHLYTAADERIATYKAEAMFGPVWRWTLRGLDSKVVREFQSFGDADYHQMEFFLWKGDHYFASGTMLAAIRDEAEGGVRHFHVDHLGTPRLVTNANGEKISSHAYLPYGIESTSILQERQLGFEHEEILRFTGHERDGVDRIFSEHTDYIDYMHARYYSPNWGRFLSVDPKLDTAALITTPQSWNRYSYADNNPVLKIDPDGLQAVIPVPAPGPLMAFGPAANHAYQMQTNEAYRRAAVENVRTVTAVTRASAGVLWNTFTALTPLALVHAPAESRNTTQTGRGQPRPNEQYHYPKPPNDLEPGDPKRQPPPPAVVENKKAKAGWELVKSILKTIKDYADDL